MQHQKPPKTSICPQLGRSLEPDYHPAALEASNPKQLKPLLGTHL